MKMVYTRINERVFFLLPAFAVGTDENGDYFFEVGLFNFAIGLGRGFDSATGG